MASTKKLPCIALPLPGFDFSTLIHQTLDGGNSWTVIDTTNADASLQEWSDNNRFHKTK